MKNTYKTTQVKSFLYDQLLAGDCRIGDAIPSINSLCAKTQASASTVKSAIKDLKRSGLLQGENGKGVFVIRDLNSLNSNDSLTIYSYDALSARGDIAAIVNQFNSKFNRTGQRVFIKNLNIRNYQTEYKNHVHAENNKNNNALFLLPDYLLESMITNGKLRNISVLSKKIHSFNPELLAPATQEDKIFALPSFFSPIMICCNRNLFNKKKVQIPACTISMNDFSTLCGQMTEKKKNMILHYGCAISTAACRFPALLASFGGYFAYNADMKTFDKNVKAMDYVNHLIKKKTAIIAHQESLGNAEKLFFRGQSAMILTSYFALDFIKQNKPNFSLQLMPMPRNPDGSCLFLSEYFCVPSQSKIPAITSHFINFFYDQSNSRLFRNKFSAVSACMQSAAGISKEPRTNKKKPLIEINTEISGARLIGNNSEPQLSQIFSEALTMMTSQLFSPTEAVLYIHKNYKNIIFNQ